MGANQTRLKPGRYLVIGARVTEGQDPIDVSSKEIVVPHGHYKVTGNGIYRIQEDGELITTDLSRPGCYVLGGRSEHFKVLEGISPGEYVVDEEGASRVPPAHMDIYQVGEPGFPPDEEAEPSVRPPPGHGVVYN